MDSGSLYYIQYMKKNNIVRPTREQINAAWEYALKMVEKEYMREDRKTGCVGMLCCISLMIVIVFCLVCLIMEAR